MSKLIRLAAVPAIPALLSVTLPAAALADEAPDSSIVVTALRTPVAQDRVSSSVTVLDEAAIVENQPIALTDILLRTPGISLSRNGGYGTVTSLRIRGADGGQTVMVLDGMRLSDPSSTAGGFGFANLLLDDAERIEILRGPQSILWGSDAIGGVVNVTTRKPEKALEGSFAVEGGSHETFSARAGAGGTSEAVDWRLSGSTFTTDGISARANGTEDDGYRRSAASGTVTVRLAAQVSLDLRGYYSDARNDFDGYAGDSPAYGLTQEWSGYAGLNFSLLDGKLTNRLAVMQSMTDRENYDPTRDIRSITFDAHGRVRRFEYQGTYSFSDAIQLMFGAEREEQRMTTASPSNSTAAYAKIPHKADTNSVYGQLRVTPATGFTVDAGVRYDHQSRFGGNTVISGGAAYTPNDGATMLRASYSEGYKAPSLYQMFSAYGVADLGPEKAKGWEVGAEQSLGQILRVSATWFERDTENLINFAYCPTSGTLPDACYIPGTTTTRFGHYANVDKSHTRGLELAGSARWNVFFAEANYSWIEAEDRTPDSSTYGRQLARVPRHLANAQAGVELPSGLRGSVAARYSGRTFDSASGTTELDGYWLFDVRAQWPVTEGLMLQGRVENLADKTYETAGGYAAFGRTFYLGLRSRF
ncbi:TonB-dependent receptor plug domain-containing protein [Novosphingobium mangrovi (ex Huang et al. 2023)]|uniref:TonB-dependent receptor n=1 Tax=Novosphingobium mangrovi (ex Huang et al. 2023) TaxID=2976432 RepID=A0ABT2IA97_9SPHN|nr:TonB-dependent receptor [Novosphingobium mangrovi (ex Huang et al. 2023)]MCT2401427.1 TonB-dependent receptor [Novosphingobium mangrovi (ex Huang et al. 2023)]